MHIMQSTKMRVKSIWAWQAINLDYYFNEISLESR